MSNFMNKSDDVKIIKTKEELLKADLAKEDLFVEKNEKMWIVSANKEDEAVHVEDENFNEYIFDDIEDFSKFVFDRKIGSYLFKFAEGQEHIVVGNSIVPPVFEFEVEVIDHDSVSNFEKVYAGSEKIAKETVAKSFENIEFGKVKILDSVPF